MKHLNSGPARARRRITKWSILAALALVFACAVWVLLTTPSLRKISFTFAVDDPGRFAALELAAPEQLHDWTLNGKPVPVPFEGMLYDKIPAIPPTLLVKGENILQVAVPFLPQFSLVLEASPEGEPFDLAPKSSLFTVRISGLTAASPCLFTIGPVLGYAGTDFFTVACQTNMPVPVRLEVDGRVLDSPAGAVHSWRIEGLQPGRDYEYRLQAVHPLTGTTTFAGPHHVKTFAAEGDLSFVACGDSRTNPEVWARVAGLIGRQNPAFFIHTGDMAREGFLYNDWLREMFQPAAGLLACMPIYPVIGNHEYKAEVFQRILRTPSGKTNWEQRIGPAHIIGIDGELDWRPGGSSYAWLEDVLTTSTAPFIFLVTHYPPYSSARHGDMTGGEPDEKPARQIHAHILPLLMRAHGTAIIAGHSHSYERSELDGGLSLITTAGAGAGLMNPRENAQEQNPYSRIYVKAYHIVTFHIHTATCEMKALDLDGKVLDSRTWRARLSDTGTGEAQKHACRKKSG